jgi:hypothetical protein
MGSVINTRAIPLNLIYEFVQLHSIDPKIHIFIRYQALEVPRQIEIDVER